MADHYYTAQPESKHKPGLVTYTYREEALRFETDSGVFSRTEIDKGTDILLRALPESVGGDVLDMGCGSGILGIGAKKLGAGELCAVDIDEAAVRTTEENLLKNEIRCLLLCL